MGLFVYCVHLREHLLKTRYVFCRECIAKFRIQEDLGGTIGEEYSDPTGEDRIIIVEEEP